MNSQLEPQDVVRLLTGRVEDLAVFLIGAAPSTKSRSHWRWGTNGSLALAVAGLKRGRFFDHEAGAGGDALELVQHIRRRGPRDAWRWSLEWLGKPPPAAPPPQPEQRQESKPDQGVWATIWRAARRDTGNPAEQYLASRGLVPALEAPLRFHQACPRGAEVLPALLALMTHPETGRPCGVHRTFLRPDGSGKADFTPAKMMLGAAGVVRLTPDEDVTTGLGICEGIETGLAIIQRMGWSPVWAVGSAGGIARFPVLTGIEALTIFADHDPIKPNGKQPGLDAANECARRWFAAGREATVQLPPLGEDWLDALGRVE